MPRFYWIVNIESTESYVNYRSRQKEVDSVSVQRDRDKHLCGCGEEEQTNGRPVDWMKCQVVPGCT